MSKKVFKIENKLRINPKIEIPGVLNPLSLSISQLRKKGFEVYPLESTSGQFGELEIVDGKARYKEIELSAAEIGEAKIAEFDLLVQEINGLLSTAERRFKAANQEVPAALNALLSALYQKEIEERNEIQGYVDNNNTDALNSYIVRTTEAEGFISQIKAIKPTENA